MRNLIDIVESSRSAPLYHQMEYPKTINVCMPARWVHNLPDLGEVYGNSFSRNKHRHLRGVTNITVDQAKLAERFKIIPLDGEAIYRRIPRIPIGVPKDRPRSQYDALQEEFIVGDIRNLHKYMISVELTAKYPHSDNTFMDLYQSTKEYCDKWSIPLTLDEEFEYNLNHISQKGRQGMQELDEDVSKSGKFYHVTFAARLPKIMQDGLVSGKRRVWKDSFGTNQGSRTSVYLFSSPIMAIRWAHKMEYEFGRKASILVVNNPPGNIKPDNHIEAQMNGKTWFTTDAPIPPSCISKVVPLTNDLCRKAVAAWPNDETEIEEL